MSRIYGNVGFKGLWNGLPVRILMIGTLTGMSFPAPGPSRVLAGQSSFLKNINADDLDSVPMADLRYMESIPGLTHDWRPLIRLTKCKVWC